jgi:UDP-2,4-diacetamido-2,4,6-trideoxy-beta-L-altropyranose hydrolase
LALEERLQAENTKVIRLPPCAPPEDSHRTADFARQLNAEWVVVDAYQFGFDCQHAINQSGKKLLLLDDNGDCAEYVADLVLNPNLHAHESMYAKRAPHTRLLLGPRFALLRREFTKYAGRKWETSREIRKLLVTFGGSDPLNLTQFVLEAFDGIKEKDLHVTVVVGGGNPHLSKLQELAAAARFPVQLITDASDMGAIMAETDIAISAAGSTCWEMCFMGLPAIIIDVAPNQTALAQSLGQPYTAGKSQLRDAVAGVRAPHGIARREAVNIRERP